MTEHEKGGQLARLAGMLCQQEAFHRFVVHHQGPAPDGVSLVQYSADFIRTQCGINSRAKLDHDQKAADLFHIRVRRPFVAWRENEGQVTQR